MTVTHTLIPDGGAHKILTELGRALSPRAAVREADRLDGDDGVADLYLEALGRLGRRLFAPWKEK